MKAVLVLLLGLSSVASAAAPPVVANVRATQMPGTKLVDIYYDVADPDGDLQTIDVRVSADGGLTYSVPCVTLTGAVGAGVTVGTNKHIVWNAGTDWNGNFMDKTKVRVTATDGNLPSAPTGMVCVPAGIFQMGDTLDPASPAVSNIQVDQFYMDKTEVSKALYDSVRVWALSNGYSFGAGGVFSSALHPVHSVTWNDAVRWCNARSQKEGLVPCYYTNTAQTAICKTGTASLTNAMVKWTATGYRLPTEAEWEKAARGALTGKRFTGGDTITHSQANYLSNAAYIYDISPTRGAHPTYGNGTAPTGSFPANGYGFYDMAGNVIEWTWDWYGVTLGVPSVTNPTGPVTGSYRVLRGGDWFRVAYYSRAVYRSNAQPVVTTNYIGFRTVRR